MRNLSSGILFSALIVFGLWFSIASFFFEPISSHRSRKYEFAADAFAKDVLDNNFHNLAKALLKLRESNLGMPIAHPLYSKVYYSHPPIIERLKAMGYV